MIVNSSTEVIEDKTKSICQDVFQLDGLVPNLLFSDPDLFIYICNEQARELKCKIKHF